MSVRSRRASRLATAAIATCAVALTTTAPGIARPAGTGESRGAVQQASADLRGQSGVQTGSLAGTSEANLGASIDTRSDRIPEPGDGTATLVVLLIAGGALAAGASAGFAGARRVALRTH